MYGHDAEKPRPSIVSISEHDLYYMHVCLCLCEMFFIFSIEVQSIPDIFYIIVGQ